ncbi:4409_t:CDS:2, partial [Gigaspora rosea]
PFCIVNENGYHCDVTDQNSWRINNQEGLVFSDLKFEGQQCQTFIPPKNQNEANFLVQLMSNSSFGSQFLSNITGTWTNPFDFLGNCRDAFFCDTSINGVTPCFSENQCDTHRCTGDFMDNNGTNVKNYTVLTPNGQPILTNQICAALGDLRRPILTFQPPEVPATEAINTPEIIILSIISTAAVLIIFIILVRIQKYGLREFLRIFNLLSTISKNDPSKQINFKDSSDDDVGSISSDVATSLLPPLPSGLGADLNYYNVSRTSHVSSISDFSPRGSNFGSIGIINMTNVGIGGNNLIMTNIGIDVNNISIPNSFERVKLARVQSQTAKIFDPESYILQLQQEQQNNSISKLQEQNEFISEQEQNNSISKQQEQNEFISEQDQNNFISKQQEQNDFVSEQEQNNFISIQQEQEQNEFVSEKNEFVSEKNEFVSEKNEFVSEKNEFISEKNELISVKNELISEKNEFISEKNELISEKNELFSEKNELISEKNEFISEKNELISEKNELISEKNEFISEPKEEIIEKFEDHWIEDEITRENALNATFELEDMVIVRNPDEEMEEEKIQQKRRQKKSAPRSSNIFTAL